MLNNGDLLNNDADDYDVDDNDEGKFIDGDDIQDKDDYNKDNRNNEKKYIFLLLLLSAQFKILRVLIWITFVIFETQYYKQIARLTNSNQSNKKICIGSIFA